MSLMARLPEADNLNDQQHRFVAALLEGATNAEALKLADYSDTVSAAKVLRSPSVQGALRAGRRAILRGELGGEAIKALRELLSAKTPAATRLGAVKLVLELDDDDDSEDRPHSEMSIAELEALIARKEAELKDVTPRSGA